MLQKNSVKRIWALAPAGRVSPPSGLKSVFISQTIDIVFSKTSC